MLKTMYCPYCQGVHYRIELRLFKIEKKCSVDMVEKYNSEQ